MTDRDVCAAIRELAAEVALGIATARERAQVLGHVAGCSSCRTDLAELSGVADELLSLVPSGEPPTGFESAVFDMIRDAAPPPPGTAAAAQRRVARSSRRRMLARAAAVVVLVAALTGGIVGWAGRADRELAAGVRKTLATSNGQYFVAFPLRDPQAVRRGAVFAYEGDPSWMVLTFDEPLADGPYSVELVGGDGVTHPVAGDVNLSADRAWGTQIPIAVHEAVLVRVLDDAGTPVMSAQLMRP